ncbi:GPI mannosyltransferase 3 [Gryllus bimaculatus]|nr:Mannosyltransferase [Gryllus bimaculatus]GLH01718.1 GPI mannosyltransferase 3 [Gryllus bimaculatus]
MYVDLGLKCIDWKLQIQNGKEMHRTAFVPDEYWQSLEVAHSIVFHYGNITWEWQEGLRSYIYPSIFAVLYKVLQFFEMDTLHMMVMAPRFLQACISIVSDAYFCNWVSREVPGAGGLAIFAVSSAWFWLFCSTRTLINTIETSLSVIALYYYPWPEEKSKSKKNNLRLPENLLEARSSAPFLALVGIAGIIRPTAVIPWIPLCLCHIITSPHNIQRTVVNYLLVGLLCLSVLLTVDCYFYEQIIFTPINFLFVNVVKNVSNFYGTHPTHWYLSSALPTVFGLHLIPCVLGCIKSFSRSDMPVKIIKLLAVSMLFTIGVYSMYSLRKSQENLTFTSQNTVNITFPLMLPERCLSVISSLTRSSDSFSLCYQWLYLYPSAGFSTFRKRVVLHFIFLLASVIPCLYLGLFHQRGTLDVMQDLAQDAVDNPLHTDLLFLMPCHSTPLYSHLHVNVSTRYLTCDPRDLFHSNLLQDEADEFYHDPIAWLEKNLNSLPSHIIMFDVLYHQVAEFLNSRSYKVFNCYHHAHFAEGRVGQVLYVLKQGSR